MSIKKMIHCKVTYETVAYFSYMTLYGQIYLSTGLPQGAERANSWDGK